MSRTDLDEPSTLTAEQWERARQIVRDSPRLPPYTPEQLKTIEEFHAAWEKLAASNVPGEPSITEELIRSRR